MLWQQSGALAITYPSAAIHGAESVKRAETRTAAAAPTSLAEGHEDCLTVPQQMLGRAARPVPSGGRVVRTKVKVNPPWRREPWQAATSPKSPLTCRSPESLGRRLATSCEDNHQTITCCRAPTPPRSFTPPLHVLRPALP
ncbi:hypothetical protein PSPO01_15220 [Paraphaeosphaeria sporulosa]